MSEKRNSASRILELLISAKKMPDNVLMADALIKTLNIQTGNRNQDYLCLTQKIDLLFHELALMRNFLERNNIRQKTYEPVLSKIEYCLSPTMLNAGWISCKQQLSEDVFVGLNFFLDLMPDEETEVSPNDMQSLAQELEDLDSALDTSEISDYLKLIIKHYINAIRTALSNYPIAGAKGLKKASKEVVGEIFEAQSELKEAESSPAIQKFVSLWRRVNATADAAIKAEKLGQIILKALDFLSH